jgi:prephenate dehydratase/chorismate mutase/prephenate dehydratase
MHVRIPESYIERFLMRVSKTICSALLMSLVCSFTAAGCGTAPAVTAEAPASEATDVMIMSDARVSYLGPAGTYTEEAAQFFFPDASAFLPESTVPEAIADVVSGEADYAVIPQENTLGGAVTNYVDALIASEDMFVVREVILPISQTLMGVPGASVDDIRTVCSHAQGIAQSETWRKEHLPDAEVKEMASTAAAAEYVAETGDKSIAAVAAPGAATLYGLSVLAESVQITGTNKTRFYVLSASRIESTELTNAVLVAACEAGLIDDIVVAVHDAGLELVTIHDRPKGSYLGDYNYILEVENRDGIHEEQLEPVLKFSEVRFLGSFSVREKTK